MDDAPALRQIALGRPVPARDRACRGGRAGARHHRLLYPPQPRRVPATGQRAGGSGQRATHLWPGRRQGPALGQVFRNPDLARTYRAIAAGGRDAFYQGDLARTVDRYFKRIGGWLRYEDLAAHRSEWIEPNRTDYRGTTVHALGANTQGLATLQMLNILERFDLKGRGSSRRCRSTCRRRPSGWPMRIARAIMPIRISPRSRSSGSSRRSMRPSARS
ncbi:gamma-glutamyltransferase [Sphingomonas aurantiaca]